MIPIVLVASYSIPFIQYHISYVNLNLLLDNGRLYKSSKVIVYAYTVLIPCKPIHVVSITSYSNTYNGFMTTIYAINSYMSTSIRLMTYGKAIWNKG